MDSSFAPQQQEHRLVMRVLARWRALADGRGLPRRSQIDPRAFGEDWRHCLLIDLDPRPERSRLAFVGEGLRDPSWPTFERQSIADCQKDSLLHLATAYIARVAAKGVPISSGGVGIHEGVPIVYRSILLPLSEGGGKIDGLLGAANYREIPVAEEIHAFREHPTAAADPAELHAADG
ncbi:MAG TPA: PAS domain-containing protein [Stellaceae bacterium]|nr:PAS domain-containing protein [Stellaceae bacterium]